MNVKLSKRSFPVGLAVGLSLGGLISGWFASSPARAEKREDSPHATLEQLSRVLVAIENRYVDPVDRDRLIVGAIKGMVEELDPHSVFFPKDEYKEFNAQLEGKFGGVGIEVDQRGDFITVVSPIEGGPAEAAGIRPGDEIIEIEGKDARSMPLERAVRIMRGDPGTKVEITIRRPSDGKTFRVPMVRREIKLPSVDHSALPGGVAYIRIRQFRDRTKNEFVDAVVKERAALGGKIAGVVLDLRRNPGGLVDAAVGIADEMLDKGVIFSTKSRGKTVDETKARLGGVLTAPPIVVIVDEGSASAAELLAGALQDNHRATIVGVTTYGKGSVQSIMDLPGGAGVKLTIARYYAPSGRAIQSLGITPDVTVEALKIEVPLTPYPKEKDLARALPAEPGGSVKPPVIPVLPAASTSSSVVAATPLPTRKPDLEKDLQLRIAHQIVRGVLARR